MKNIVFVVCILLSSYHLLRVLKIVLYDLDRLTEYGSGFLAGMILLCILFAGLAVMTKLKWKQK